MDDYNQRQTFPVCLNLVKHLTALLTTILVLLQNKNRRQLKENAWMNGNKFKIIQSHNFIFK